MLTTLVQSLSCCQHPSIKAFSSCPPSKILFYCLIILNFDFTYTSCAVVLFSNSLSIKINSINIYSLDLGKSHLCITWFLILGKIGSSKAANSFPGLHIKNQTPTCLVDKPFSTLKKNPIKII